MNEEFRFRTDNNQCMIVEPGKLVEPIENDVEDVHMISYSLGAT